MSVSRITSASALKRYALILPRERRRVPSYVQQCGLISASVPSCMVGTSLGTPARATLKYTLAPSYSPCISTGWEKCLRNARVWHKFILQHCASGMRWHMDKFSRSRNETTTTLHLQLLSNEESGSCLYQVFHTAHYCTVFCITEKNVCFLQARKHCTQVLRGKGPIIRAWQGIQRGTCCLDKTVSNISQSISSMC